MSAPILIPRGVDQLVVDSIVVTKTVLDRLKELFGLDFPIGDSTRSSFVTSEPLYSVPYNRATRAFLKSKGYRLDRLTHGTVRLSKNGPLSLSGPFWDFALPTRGKRNQFKFEVWFSMQAQDAVSLLLETRPMASNGNHKDAAALARLFVELGYELPPFVRWLCAAGGQLLLSWQQLGIEPSVSMEKYFKDFVESHKSSFPLDGNPVSIFINHLAHTTSLSPFRPAPFYLLSDRSGSMLLDVDVRVPESCYKDLRSHWLEQLYTFGETYIPRRPE